MAHALEAKKLKSGVAVSIDNADVTHLRTVDGGGIHLPQVNVTTTKSKNVEPQTVIDALVAEAKARLAGAVTAGKLTQAQADTRLTDETTTRRNHHDRRSHGRRSRLPC